MTPPKLSDHDKNDVVKLYRVLDETTSTIASRYGVSSTTIGRILKSHLSEDEYELLMQQKRSARNATPISSDVVENPPTLKNASLPDSDHVNSSEAMPIEFDNFDALTSIGASDSITTEPVPIPSPILVKRQPKVTSKDYSDDESADEESISNESSMVEDEEFYAQDSDDEELEDDDDLDNDDLDDDDLDDDDLDASADDAKRIVLRRSSSEEDIQVLPLSDAVLTHTIYLVVDRTSELITHPLKDFGDLGAIPSSEVQEITLPVFDNHRVARRFSKKNQKVVKVPNGNLLSKTSLHLQSKGITRLLIDGQVYAL